jgi:hypothetical protein
MAGCMQAMPASSTHKEGAGFPGMRNGCCNARHIAMVNRSPITLAFLRRWSTTAVMRPLSRRYRY